MVDILDEYKKQYVPSREEDTTGDRLYVTTLVGGDYLSVARAR